MAGLHPLEYDPDAPTQFSMAAGTYSGESAIAAGLFHNPNKDVLLSVGFSISGSEKAANVGATFRFGRSSESKVRKVIEDKQREQELAVSQTECASKLGISQTHLSNIEHGRSGITLQMLCRVCDILQVSLDYLVRGAEKNDEKKHSEITIDEVVRVIKMLKGIEEK